MMWEKKLKSNRGASMILALALMLICIMVASVIVSTAASGTSRSMRRTSQQQDYLAVSAASDLIAEDLKNAGEFIGTIEVRVKECQKYNNPTTVMYNGVAVPGYWVTVPPVADCYAYYIVDVDGEGLCDETDVKSVHERTSFSTSPFGELMKAAATHVYMNEAAYSQSFTVSVPQEEMGKDRLPVVEASFTMSQNYDVTILLTTENEDNSYAVTIRLNPTIIVDDTGDVQTIKCHHKVCYKVERDGELVTVYPSQKQEFSYHTTAPEIHVTWGSPVITKEVGVQ